MLICFIIILFTHATAATQQHTLGTSSPLTTPPPPLNEHPPAADTPSAKLDTTVVTPSVSKPGSTACSHNRQTRHANAHFNKILRRLCLCMCVCTCVITCMTLRSQVAEHERPLAANSLRPALQAKITYSIALQRKLGRYTATGSGTARDCARARWPCCR